MKQFITASRNTEEIEKIVCDMCGEPIKKNDLGRFEDHLSIEKRWGYGSRYDNEVHAIDLCQECYEKLLTQLKSKPTS